MHAFPDIHSVETINPIPPPTNWTPNFTHQIAVNREDAINQANNTSGYGLTVYTDGSGYKGGIGEAAYARDKHDRDHVRRLYLGNDRNHTVFEGEVIGAILALDIIRACPRATAATIMLDNQAAIRALSSGRGKAGQYLLDLFHAELGSL